LDCRGWRIGWAVMGDDVREATSRSASTPSRTSGPHHMNELLLFLVLVDLLTVVAQPISVPPLPTIVRVNLAEWAATAVVVVDPLLLRLLCFVDGILIVHLGHLISPFRTRE